MEICTAEDECPVCMGTIQNPSEPSPCCNKVFCQSCLTESTRIRRHCPHCRTPVPSLDTITNRSVRNFQLPGLADRNDIFRTGQPVGNNLQELINQLRDSSRHLQAAHRSIFSAVSLASQAADAPAAQATPPSSALNPQRRRPFRLHNQTRLQANVLSSAAAPVVRSINPSASNVQAAPSAPPDPPQALLTGPASSNPVTIPDSSNYMLDEMAWRTEIADMERTSRQPSGPIVRTFSCPYCQQGGLDDLELREHCNGSHLNDTRHVVCPICVSLPHGNPLYHSRDFIAHLNLRHSYYIQDVTNVHQSDDVNLQAAILNSLTPAN